MTNDALDSYDQYFDIHLITDERDSSIHFGIARGEFHHTWPSFFHCDKLHAHEPSEIFRFPFRKMEGTWKGADEACCIFGAQNSLVGSDHPRFAMHPPGLGWTQPSPRNPDPHKNFCRSISGFVEDRRKTFHRE